MLSCIVTKFGGSSLANDVQFRKVRSILDLEPSRRYLVPSAPGKRFPGDEKVTDLLYLCYSLAEDGRSFEEEFDKIEERYLSIARGLGLDCPIGDELAVIRKGIADLKGRDWCASRGEYLCGLLMSYYLGWRFLDAAEGIVFRPDGRLDDAFYGIYTVNRVEYPAYNGGVGASVLAMFLQPIVMPFRFLIDSFPLSRYEAVGHRLLQAAVLCVGIFSLIWQSRKVGEVGFVTLWLATFGFAVRGLFNFHDSPCVALLAVWITAAAVDLMLELPKKRKTLMTAGRVIFAMGMLICCLDIYDLWLLAHRQPVPDLSFPQYHTEDARVLAELTDPDEEVWALSFANDALMVADRLPCGNAVNTPWTWVKIGRKQFEAIQANPPRVAYYRDDFYVPGFPLDGYAPETIRFLKEHYEKVEGTEYVWVYKD